MPDELNEQTIFRRAKGKENPYFLTPRATAQNKELSYDALGMLAYLLSKPDDWQIRLKDLQRKDCGRDKARNIMRELVECGHAVRVQGHGARGRFIGSEYYIYDSPQPENPATVNPATVNPTLHNRDQDSHKKKENTQRNAREADEEGMSDVPKDDRLQIIRAWAQNLGAHPVSPYTVKNQQIAAEIFRAGYRPGHVAAFVKAKKMDGWWKGKTLTLTKVSELLPEWVLGQTKDAGAASEPGEATVYTLEDYERDLAEEEESNG